MNKHDERRRAATIKALEKAKECLELERLYLYYSENPKQRYNVTDALEHLDIVLERLTAAGGETSDEKTVDPQHGELGADDRSIKS